MGQKDLKESNEWLQNSVNELNQEQEDNVEKGKQWEAEAEATLNQLNTDKRSLASQLRGVGAGAEQPKSEQKLEELNHG